MYSGSKGFKVVIDATNMESINHNMRVMGGNGQGDGILRKLVEVVILKP